MTTQETFWIDAFDADERRGLTIRVGPWRCAPVNDRWGALEDGAEYPNGHAWDTRQDAVDWMVAAHRAELLIAVQERHDAHDARLPHQKTSEMLRDIVHHYRMTYGVSYKAARHQIRRDLRNCLDIVDTRKRLSHVESEMSR